MTVVLRPESKFDITPATINGFSPARIRMVKVSFDDEEELVKTLVGQDAVVVSISKGGIRAQKALIDAAVKAGVKRFIPSEFGGDTLDDGLMRNVPVLREKRVVLDYLKAAAKENPSFTWTGISSAAFLDWVCIPRVKRLSHFANTLQPRGNTLNADRTRVWNPGFSGSR